jgi:hypothetical protein
MLVGNIAYTEPGDYELIQTQILGSSQNAIVFNNLENHSSTYRHFQLRVIGRAQRAFTNEPLFMRFNGDSGTNYAWNILFTSGSSVASAGDGNTNVMRAGILASANSASNNFGASVIDILDVYQAKNKSIRYLASLTNDGPILGGGIWRSTNAISSITLTSWSGTDFIAGSRFSLYGIRG